MKEKNKPAQLEALRTEKEKTAVAIEYVPGEAAPKILATGKGEVSIRIFVCFRE